jgi:hypothetical protein
MARNCGECLFNAVEIVELDANGVCPRCGTDYGPDSPTQIGTPRLRYGREKTPGCDCEQNGQTDPEYHASDCTWRMRT